MPEAIRKELIELLSEYDVSIIGVICIVNRSQNNLDQEIQANGQDLMELDHFHDCILHQLIQKLVGKTIVQRLRRLTPSAFHPGHRIRLSSR